MNNKKDNFADIRKILMKALHNWYYFLGVLLIAFAVAYFANKYTRSVYIVTSKVLVKSRGDGSTAAGFLYGSDISSDIVTEGVESHYLRSYPIISKTIRRLKFTHRFSVEDEIGTKLAYGWEPAEMQIDSLIERQHYGRAYQFVVTDQDHFKFYEKEDLGGSNTLYEFGQTVDYNGFIFRAKKKKNYDYQRILNQEFTFSLRHPDYLTNEYINKLIVKAGADGAVIDISLVGTIPSREINFIRNLIRVYQEDELERKNEQANKTISFIEEELKRITDSLNLIETQVVSIRQQASPQLSQNAAALYGRLDNAEVELSQYDNKLRIYQEILNTVTQSYNFDDLSGLAALGVDDAGLKRLIDNLVAEQSRIDQNQQNAGQNTNNPFVQKARDNVERYKTSIMESINNLIATAQRNKGRIQSRASKIRSEIYSAPSAQKTLGNVERLNKISENLFILYNTKKAEAEVAAASASTDLQIIDPPMPQGGPIKQDKRNYLIAFFLGFTLPLVFIIIKDFLSNKVASKEDVESYTNIPVLGQIWRSTKNKGMLVVNDNPKSPVAESFRSIRSNLNFFTSEVDNKVFVITSSISGEGKTFSSINLSTVFAFSSKKIVLIGADLRKPKIFGDFGLKNEVGLSNYLSGSAFKSEIIQSTEIPYLDIISSGPVPPNPSELLMNSKMAELVSELKKDYEYVLIDTAPLGLVTDAFILMNHADHTIFMVRQNYTPTEAVKNVQELYQSGKLKNVSILFNDVKDQSNNYGYGYGYYGESES